MVNPGLSGRGTLSRVPAGQGMLRTKGDSGSSSPGTSKWVLWVPWRSPKERRRLSRQEWGPLPAPTTELWVLTLYFGVPCTAPPVMKVLLLNKAWEFSMPPPLFYRWSQAKLRNLFIHSFIHSLIHSFIQIGTKPRVYTGHCSAVAGECPELVRVLDVCPCGTTREEEGSELARILAVCLQMSNLKISVFSSVKLRHI